MSVGKFEIPDHTAMNGGPYKSAIKNDFMVVQRTAAAFAPREQDTPDMTVRVDAGPLWKNGELTEINAQSSSTITAPTTFNRKDRIVKDSNTALISVVPGTESASPVLPSIPVGKEPNCYVLLYPGQTTIVNTDIVDERLGGGGSGSAQLLVGDVYYTTTNHANPSDVATALGYGTWALIGQVQKASNPSLLLHCDGTGNSFVDNGKNSLFITPHGAITQDNSKYAFGSGKSAYFSAVTDYLTATHSDFGFAGDLTLDFWLWRSNNYDEQLISGTNWFVAYESSAKRFNIYSGGAWSGYPASYPGGGAQDPLEAAMWHHVAISKSGRFVLIFVDGCMINTPFPSAGLFVGSGDLQIGGSLNQYSGYRGWMDEIRIINGEAVFKNNFKPPTAPYSTEYNIYAWVRTL